MKKIILLLVIFILSSCVNEVELFNEDAVQIKVLCYKELIRKNYSALQDRAYAYFITNATECETETGRKKFCNQRNPKNEVLKRLSDITQPRILTHSDYEWRDRYIVDKNTGGKGYLLIVCDIIWNDPNKVKVAFGYYEGNMAASFEYAYLEKIDGKWILYDREKIWIS